jgi:transposase
MAFIRKEVKESGTYLRFVESYRDENGKSRHRTLFNLGKAEDYNAESLKRMGKLLYELGGGNIEELENKQLKESARYNYGFPQVVKILLEAYSLDTFFGRRTQRSCLGFNLMDSITMLICERLNDPVSKRSSYVNQQDYLGLETIELHQIYRTLDQLYEIQEPIKSMIYHKGRNLFNQKLDVVFYDVTTFYFDSDKEDELREKGFGKDGKIGKTIIVFGMLIDQNKQPVGYEVYHGKQYEGHTFKDAIKRLKKQYEIRKVICVADSGMMNTKNLAEVQNNDYEYIIGERLKNISQAKQIEILDLEKYQTLSIVDQDSEEEIQLQYYITDYNNKKLITTYSKKRAAKDKAQREERIEKAKKLLLEPSQLEKKANAYFLKKDGKQVYSLNEEKIEHNARFDGFRTIATNNTGLSASDILDAYKDLYKIEQSFRSFKTFLETRPMYHWTEKRILGHLALCYISFALLNYLQLRLRQKGTPLSENKIRKALIKMQISLISQNTKQYYMSSQTPEDATKIIKALKIKTIPDFIPAESIKNYT